MQSVYVSFEVSAASAQADPLHEHKVLVVAPVLTFVHEDSDLRSAHVFSLHALLS